MFCNKCGNEVKEGTKFCTKCGFENFPIKKQRRKIFTKKRIAIFAVFLVVLVFLIGLLSPNNNENVASSVVNIYCKSKSTNESVGGSGTILTESGIVLTNAHIIPDSEKEEITPVCMVTLPDPATGSPKEIYYAYPIIIPEISKKYDLAFVQIDDVYIDEEGTAYGDYPKIFPAYDNSKYCGKENIKLGEPVRIYGYPAISGGYALTVTDGVVSSLLIDEGLIVTSAKISNGNSGGLAVDQYGCMLGVPSMVSVDENESLGVIISSDLVSEFAQEVMAFVNNKK